VESFNAFLDSTRIPVNGTADMDRQVIEGFLAYLHTHSAGVASHRIRIGQFNTFLLTMRRHGWVTDLPSTAQIYTEDYPKETVRQPRALSEHVMAQLENPENLAKMSTPHHRLITLILIRCGLRISDTVTLTQDCITRFPSHLGHQTDHLDVPQEVVRRILDRDSHQMTAHYTRLSDPTIRRHWEAARKVNASGSVVELDPDGPLAEAAWSKQRLGRATQALPNGYCGLPVQKSRPHAKACRTCPMFIRVRPRATKSRPSADCALLAVLDSPYLNGGTPTPQ
jgi:hypothetical protein